MKTLKISLIVCASVFLLSNCKDEPINIFTLQDDIALGKQLKEEIASDPATYPILDETLYPEAYQHLRRIRDSLLATGKVNYKDSFAWEVYIINQDVLNAFAAPGGYLYFYTGLIKFLDNEAQFAGVLGHEMAHAARRHSTSQLTKAYGISVLLSVLVGEDPGLLSQIAASLLILKFSRTHEDDADAHAVQYLYATHYDARGVAGFFEKLQAADSTGSVEVPFLSTHPSDEHRIERIYTEWTTLGGKEGTYDSLSFAAFKASLP